MQAATPTPQQLPLVPRTIPLLPILPPQVRAMLAGRSVGSERQPVITLPAQVKRILRQPEKFIYTKGLLQCHQIWEWRVRCMDCNQLIRMDADHLVPAEAATPPCSPST